MVKAFHEIGISDSDLQKIIVHFKIENYQKGDRIFKHGDDGDYFYIVMSGQVDLYLPNPDVKKLKLEIQTVERHKTRCQITLAETEQKKMKFSKIQLMLIDKIKAEIDEDVALISNLHS